MLEGLVVMSVFFGCTAPLVAWRFGDRPWSRILGWWATSWAAVLVLLGAALPIVSVNNSQDYVVPRHTLVRVYGWDVLVLVALPLVLCLFVVALLAAGRRGSRWHLEVLAIIVSVVLVAASAVGFITFLIGLFVLPAAGLLLAASLEQMDARRRTEHHRAPLQPGPVWWTTPR